MRLGIVTTSYPRTDGDWAGGFVAGHARWLERAGHTVDVVAAGDGPGRVWAGAGLFYGEGAPDRLARSPLAWWNAARFSAGLIAETRRRARDWDAAIAHWLAPCGVAAALAGVPAVAVAHSGDVHLLRRTRLVYPVAALLARAGVHVSFVTDELRALFLERAGGVALSTSVTPMGIDFDHFAQLPRATDGATVVFLGRLVPVKGVDTLLAAFDRVRAPATLVVAGDGPLAGPLRARAGARVRFAGEVRGAARDRLLACADVVVLPSRRVEAGRSEGMPVVALEAMAAGAHLVASRVGGLAELPQDVADLVEPDDPIALAAAIDVALISAPARVAAAREWARDHDWGRVGPRLIRALEPPEMNTLRLRRTA